MSCDRHTDAIIDHACGADITAEAAAHLDGCAACRRVFDEQRRLVQDLDGQLALALEVEPSPRFVPGVLARVERPAFGVRGGMWWAGAAAAAVVVMIVTFGSLRSPERRSDDQHAAAVPSAVSPVPIADRTPSRVAPSPGPGVKSRQAEPRRREDGRRTAATRLGPIEADVVVPATESRTLARYLALVRRGALDASTLPGPDDTSVAAPVELVIAPLAVDTLAVTDVVAGIGPVDREPETR
jgi:hypothetical protein